LITIKLMGGLGNQMFQRAYGLTLAKAGYQVAFNSAALTQPDRGYALSEFGWLPLSTKKQPAIEEQGIRFQADLLAPPDGSVMVGYWQSEKYFSHIANEVRRAFIFRRYALRSKGTIAVHVRRGDYVNLQHFHGIPERDWYIRAVDTVLNKRGNDKTIYVVSDDSQWCLDNLPMHWHVVGGIDKYHDMQIISVCEHAVISNSSFSWWGAWLGDGDPQRIVVAPKRWYAAPEMQDDQDIVPERWLRL
jgi:hypothetical protein